MENKTSVKGRNKQFDFMLAVGIIFVIFGHNHQPANLFYPAYYFHMSLFFFISGYFFKPQATMGDKLNYFIKKTKTQLIPYLLLNLLFGIITYLLKQSNINLGGDITLNNIFISPFDRGDHYTLYLSAWFLFNLYFISIIANILYQKYLHINIGIAIITFIIMLFLLEKGEAKGNSMWMTFAIRTGFGFSFFSLGFLFKQFENKLKEYILKPITIVALFLAVNILNTNFGNISYSIMTGSVGNKNVIVPVITSICIIFIIYIIAHHCVAVIKDNSVVYLIGQNTFSIMVWHFTAFWLVNFILYSLGFVPFKELSNVYFKLNVDKLWLIYQIPAVVFPIMLANAYRNAKQSLISYLPSNKASTAKKQAKSGKTNKKGISG